MARRIGPFTITTGPTGIVVASTPWMLNSSVHAASTAGQHHREVLGLAAGHHRVDGDLLDGALDEVGRDDRDDLVGRAGRALEHARAPWPRWARTTGRPSVQPRANRASASSSRSASSTRRLRRTEPLKRTRSSSTRLGSTDSDPQPGRNSGRSAPRPATPLTASHCGRCQPTVRSTSRAVDHRSASARSRCRGASEGQVGVEHGVEAVGEGGVVLGVDGEPRAGSELRSTGATISHVSHSRLTTATRPSGSGGDGGALSVDRCGAVVVMGGPPSVAAHSVTPVRPRLHGLTVASRRRGLRLRHFGHGLLDTRRSAPVSVGVRRGCRCST